MRNSSSMKSLGVASICQRWCLASHAKPEDVDLKCRVRHLKAFREFDLDRMCIDAFEVADKGERVASDDDASLSGKHDEDVSGAVALSFGMSDLREVEEAGEDKLHEVLCTNGSWTTSRG